MHKVCGNILRIERKREREIPNNFVYCTDIYVQEKSSLSLDKTALPVCDHIVTSNIFQAQVRHQSENMGKYSLGVIVSTDSGKNSESK